MAIKQGLLPKKHIVIRDLKRGMVGIETDKEQFQCTLSNAFIPEQFMAETNPNHPLEQDEVHAWDTEKRRWIKFNISELTKYQPAGGEIRVEERREDAEDPRGTGHQSTEEDSQEA